MTKREFQEFLFGEMVTYLMIGYDSMIGTLFDESCALCSNHHQSPSYFKLDSPCSKTTKTGVRSQREIYQKWDRAFASYETRICWDWYWVEVESILNRYIIIHIIHSINLLFGYFPPTGQDGTHSRWVLHLKQQLTGTPFSQIRHHSCT